MDRFLTGLCLEATFQAVEIERPVQTNIDQPCDSAFRCRQRATFHDVRAREAPQEYVQRYEAPRRCEYLTAVEELRCGQAADQELGEASAAFRLT